MHTVESLGQPFHKIQLTPVMVNPPSPLIPATVAAPTHEGQGRLCDVIGSPLISVPHGMQLQCIGSGGTHPNHNGSLGGSGISSEFTRLVPGKDEDALRRQEASPGSP